MSGEWSCLHADILIIERRFVMASGRSIDDAPMAMQTCRPDVTILSYLDEAAEANSERDETEEQVETGQLSKWHSIYFVASL